MLAGLLLVACGGRTSNSEQVGEVVKKLGPGEMDFLMELCWGPLKEAYPEHRAATVRSMNLHEGGVMRGMFTMTQGPTPRVDMTCDVTDKGVTVRPG